MAVLELLLETKTRPTVVSVSHPRWYYNRVLRLAAGGGHDEVWNVLSAVRPLAEIYEDLDVQEQQIYDDLRVKVTGQGSKGIVELVEKFASLKDDRWKEAKLEGILGYALRRRNIALIELLLSYSSDEQRLRKRILEDGIGPAYTEEFQVCGSGS
ncbi:hypothetical protein ISF_02591 [Cordyceps fumosorosea ARSEF 2679]|uniref:Uncharacterized protein n=1 Tax=Cordyceps fumosorosea (strain ARSEF 2679) TaxID=1081104 RepID=A0A168BW05_CORFA|nr:hypothetical protein ISF_02591 [Cordyceps fumosorosea ARSEF 2679]OAA70617.1 hypothetical protein ISF_02591 [Cordyceps fumosorosea ARSEF 2679]